MKHWPTYPPRPHVNWGAVLSRLALIGAVALCVIFALYLAFQFVLWI